MSSHDWLDCEGAFDWIDQWKRMGYAELPHKEVSDQYHDVVIFISEHRWGPPQYENYVPSRLWDQATPSVAFKEMTPRERRWWKRTLDACS